MKMSADAATRAAYEARLRMQNDIIAGQSVKYKEGLAIGKRQGEEIGRKRGEEIGEARGRHDNALEIAKNLLSRKLPVEEISQIVGLPISEIEGIRSF